MYTVLRRIVGAEPACVHSLLLFFRAAFSTYRHPDSGNNASREAGSWKQPLGAGGLKCDFQPLNSYSNSWLKLEALILLFSCRFQKGLVISDNFTSQSMVSYKEVKASNALISDANAPSVAVFVGGTSGIGKFTIKELVSTGVSVRIYLVGRKSSEERARGFIQELNAINSKAEIVWAEGEISLLAESKRICDHIKTKESHVDLLFLTAGYAPFAKRTETSEGLEITQSLEYYSRMLFVLGLLPLLRKAEAARVVSVLSGGMERTGINTDDIDLKNPRNFNGFKAQMQYGAMNSLTLDKLARENPDVTFIHSWPGAVDTGNLKRGTEPNSLIDWLGWLIFEPFVKLFGTSYEESGQRHLFESTSAAFGGRGIPWKGKPGVNSLQKEENGLFLVNYKCKCTPNAKAMSVLREKAQGKIWDHTQEVLKPYL